MHESSFEISCEWITFTRIVFVNYTTVYWQNHSNICKRVSTCVGDQGDSIMSNRCLQTSQRFCKFCEGFSRFSVYRFCTREYLFSLNVTPCNLSDNLNAVIWAAQLWLYVWNSTLWLAWVVQCSFYFFYYLRMWIVTPLFSCSLGLLLLMKKSLDCITGEIHASAYSRCRA